MSVCLDPIAQSEGTSAQASRDVPVGGAVRGRVLAEHTGVLSVFLQLALIAVVVRHLDLLTSALRHTVYWAVVGFLVHHYLPARYRLRAFAGLCGVALLLVMGGSPDTLWDGAAAVYRALPMLAVGGVLVGICLMPVGFWTRAALLAAVGAVAAWCRSGRLAPGSLALIWPVLAGLFMFRVVVYLYEISTLKQRPGLSESFAYFFLFPNIAANLFPVVDFKTFARSRYDGDALEIYQRGVHRIVRGVTQLLTYRVVQQLFAINPEDVTNGHELIQYFLTNSFLYVRVSGQFHLFIGLLLLFGFNLPETNRRYFLASSFTDYWRRVNIYWKDFILTVFYYPVYFRLKGNGATFALVVATFWSFFATWALHLYQTWWLKGSATVTGPDVTFWLILALLVLANSLWEVKRGRQRKLGSGSYSARDALGLALRTGGTFAVISVLWSLWSAPTLSAWIGLWRFADAGAAAWGAATLATIMAATIAFEVLPINQKAARARAGRGASRSNANWGPFAQCAAPLAAIYLIATPTLQARLDAASLQPWYDAINTGDSMTNQLVSRNGGYYEHLMDADPGNLELWETLMGQRLPPVYQGADPRQPVKDFRLMELLPNVRTHAYLTDFSTNRWGMRDQDYALAKPAHTIRIAVVGSSHVMGFGIPGDRVFESVVERRMNAGLGTGPDRPRIEILNFGTSGLSPLGGISMVRERVAAFQPDFVLLVTHPVDSRWANRDFSRSVRERIPVRYAFLQQVQEDARIAPTTHEVIATERLTPYEPALLEWCYQQTAAEVRRIGAVPLALFLPLPENLPLTPRKAAAAAEQTALLGNTGFVLIDFTSVFAGESPKDLMLPEPTRHSNIRAHAIIADGLWKAFTSDPRIGLADALRTLNALNRSGLKSSNTPR